MLLFYLFICLFAYLLYPEICLEKVCVTGWVLTCILLHKDFRNVLKHFVFPDEKLKWNIITVFNRLFSFFLARDHIPGFQVNDAFCYTSAFYFYFSEDIYSDSDSRKAAVKHNRNTVLQKNLNPSNLPAEEKILLLFNILIIFPLETVIWDSCIWYPCGQAFRLNYNVVWLCEV